MYIYACVYVFVHLCVYTHVYVYVYAYYSQACITLALSTWQPPNVLLHTCEALTTKACLIATLAPTTAIFWQGGLSAILLLTPTHAAASPDTSCPSRMALSAGEVVVTSHSPPVRACRERGTARQGYQWHNSEMVTSATRSSWFLFIESKQVWSHLCTVIVRDSDLLAIAKRSEAVSGYCLVVFAWSIHIGQCASLLVFVWTFSALQVKHFRLTWSVCMHVGAVMLTGRTVAITSMLLYRMRYDQR